MSSNPCIYKDYGGIDH